MIGTPVHSDLKTEYVISLINTIQGANEYGVTVKPFFIPGSCIHQQRNMLLGYFLRDTEQTHLLFVDSDMSFSLNNVFTLLQYDKEFSGIAYRAKGETKCYNVYAADTSHRCGETGMIKVDSIAGGFMMLKKSVIHKMAAAYREFKCLGFPRTFRKEKMEDDLNQFYFNLFDWGVNERTKYILSEDFVFCERWRKIGGEIFIDASQELGHVGSKIYKGKLQENIVNNKIHVIPAREI